MNVLVINGPTLNLLGTREPEIYGHDTLADVERRCQSLGDEVGLNIEFKQSNHEGQIVDWIQQAMGNTQALIINGAAYTHTSVAIPDALRAYSGYKIELHISNPHQREVFRHQSYVSAAVDSVITGFGVQGYELAIEALPQILEQ